MLSQAETVILAGVVWGCACRRCCRWANRKCLHPSAASHLPRYSNEGVYAFASDGMFADIGTLASLKEAATMFPDIFNP